jgi:hypothetical protein
MKIPRVGDKLFHLNTQTDTIKPTVAFRHLGKSPDKRKRILSQNLTYFQLFKKNSQFLSNEGLLAYTQFFTTIPHIETHDSNPYPLTERASSAMFYWNYAMRGNGWAQFVMRWLSAYPCVNRTRWYEGDLNSKGFPTLPTDYNWHALCNSSTNTTLNYIIQ